MSDEQVIDPNTGLPIDPPVLSDVVDPTPVAIPEVSPAYTGEPIEVVHAGKVKALLLILGHDIEDSWEHIVALAKKI